MRRMPIKTDSKIEIPLSVLGPRYAQGVAPIAPVVEPTIEPAPMAGETLPGEEVPLEGTIPADSSQTPGYYQAIAHYETIAELAADRLLFLKGMDPNTGEGLAGGQAMTPEDWEQIAKDAEGAKDSISNLPVLTQSVMPTQEM